MLVPVDIHFAAVIGARVAKGRSNPERSWEGAEGKSTRRSRPGRSEGIKAMQEWMRS